MSELKIILKELFKLNKYETAIYLALLKEGKATVNMISKMSQVPYSRCYDIAESLCEKGLIFCTLDSKRTYVVRPIAPAIASIKEMFITDTDNRIKKLVEFKKSETFKELTNLYSNRANMSSARLSNVHTRSSINNSEILHNIVTASTNIIMWNFYDPLFDDVLRTVSRRRVKVTILSDKIIKEPIPKIKYVVKKNFKGDLIVIDDKILMIKLGEHIISAKNEPIVKEVCKSVEDYTKKMLIS